MAREEQPRGKQEQGPEKGAQGQWRVDTKDLQEGWETIKEIDKVLGHLEGRLDKVTAVIRQVAVQGGALELNAPGEDEACPSRNPQKNWKHPRSKAAWKNTG
jgi:hypothetical protein